MYMKGDKISEILPKIKKNSGILESLPLSNQPTLLFLSALEPEIKLFTSLFNHRAATPNAVAFFLLCSSRVQVRSPGDVEKMGQVELFPTDTELHLFLR